MWSYCTNGGISARSGGGDSRFLILILIVILIPTPGETGTLGMRITAKIRNPKRPKKESRRKSGGMDTCGGLRGERLAGGWFATHAVTAAARCPSWPLLLPG